jgi:glutamine synthetase
MNNALQANIRRQVIDHDVEHVQLWFADHMGELDMVEIAGNQLDHLLESDTLAGGSPSPGLGVGVAGDIVAVPDWSTFRVMPPRSGRGRTARVFCTLSSLGFYALDDTMLA